MIARSFKSVAWVAAIGAAALICYMFSLRGAAERADLAELNGEVLRLERSIRTLQTELGTRGRVHQLQHWASTDFGFVAPVANQFIENEVTLARLDQPAEPTPLEAPVRMAQGAMAAPPAQTAPAPAPAPAAPRVVQASAPQRVAPAVREAGRPQAIVQPMLRRAAVVEPAPRPALRPVAADRTSPAIRPAAARTASTERRPRAPALVSDRTLRDLSARERAERTRGGAN